ncbi:hypothetical protein HYE59_11420 [Aggregatibacter actinomycetemcomitans]|uniref:hypothetical protein n=1 Tax=Aggregatibacter actinomycetemcomitans TaxID=714 RepID=UPI00197C2E8C|nr:hypothetical protein [Aggregatibacter actinomycetemcomitans]MBN6078110.1 hypothetical protein [Aggregatibacter actinomycetemcomitans]
MKKLVLLGLTLSFLSGCMLTDLIDNGKITRRKVSGEWQCTSIYPEYNLKTVNNLRLNRDGTLVNNSTIIEPIDKPFFVYEITGTGTWRLSELENKLTYTLTANWVQRSHTEEALDAIKKDFRYKPYEENLFNKYSKRVGKSKMINFVISSLTRDMELGRDIMTLTQKTAKKNYTTSCVRQ